MSQPVTHKHFSSSPASKKFKMEADNSNNSVVTRPCVTASSGRVDAADCGAKRPTLCAKAEKCQPGAAASAGVDAGAVAVAAMAAAAAMAVAAPAAAVVAADSRTNAPSSPCPSGQKKSPWSLGSPQLEPEMSSPMKRRCVRISEDQTGWQKSQRQLVPLTNDHYEDFTRGWQTNFLRKCAELVEVRFANAIRTTCVKPFYDRYNTCWTAS